MSVVNTHIHLPPNFSAFSSVEDALDQAAEEGCVLLGASNYYDFSVYREFELGASKRGIFPLFGIEILCRDEEAAKANVRYNDPANPGKVYLCGKALRRWRDPSPRARTILSTIRQADEARMEAMAERLRKALGRGPTAAQVRKEVAEAAGVPVQSVVLQERHLAQAFQRAVDPSAASPAKAQNALRSDLMKAGKPAFVEEAFISVEEGIQLVRELGGIPAYPFVVDGMDPVSEMEGDLDRMLAWMRDNEIPFAEFIPNRNSPEALRDYVTRLDATGIPVTAGTEHNTPEKLPIAPACKGGKPIPPECDAIFRRSAHVAADHQRSQ